MPARRRVIENIEDVPTSIMDEIIDEMAERMSGTPSAKRAVGLTFAYRITGRRMRVARYTIAKRGMVTVDRGNDDADFVFSGLASDFDVILTGRGTPLTAVLRRRISVRGSLSHLRELLRMLPAVEEAYREARADLIEKYADRYDFRL